MCGAAFTKFYFPQLEEIRISFKESISTNNPISLHRTIKTLNLCYKQVPERMKSVDWINLHEIYFCIQTTRDESLILFKNYVTNLIPSKQEEISLVIYDWSWNNKNKYHLLAIVIQVVPATFWEHSSLKNALRQCLTRKNLFSSSQSVIKSLDARKSPMVHELFEEILAAGSETELFNLKSQWFTIISKKQELFDSLQFDCNNFQVNFRYLYILDMFSEVFFKNGEFKKNEFLEFLRRNIESLSDTDLLIVYKLLVNSLKLLDLQETLALILSIIKLKRNIPSPEFRNNVTGKFSDIFNFLANIPPVKSKSFFESLKSFLFEGFESKDYQPIIFVVKITLSLLKTFFADSVKGFSKKCHLSKNHVFGKQLQEQGIIDFEELQTKMIKLLVEAGEYDDIREMIVNILVHLKCRDTSILSKNFKSLAGSREINQVITSASFAKVLVNNSDIATNDFFDFCFETLSSNLKEFEKDPLKTATSGRHLFGYLNAMNEILIKKENNQQIELLEVVERIVTMVLKMMSATVFNDDENSVAVSFQVIDESLDLFVKSSTCMQAGNSEAQRKFLLLSFWLSLRVSYNILLTS